MAKSIQRKKARELRKSGKSIKEIAKLLSVSVSTASRWCSDILLTEDQIKKLVENKSLGLKRGQLLGAETLKKRRLDKIKLYNSEGLEYFKDFSINEFYSAGLALYLAEGAKKSRIVAFTNSDPKVMGFMLNWINKFYGVTFDRIKLSVLINISHKNRESEIINFWSQNLKIPINRFNKTKFVVSKRKKVYDNPNDYFGVLTFTVLKSSDLCYKILGQIQGMLVRGMDIL